MLFKMVKNEWIKLFKRSKTWIVFILFAASIVGVTVISKIEGDRMAFFNSPDGQIQMCNDNIDWMEDEIKHLEQFNDQYSKERMEDLKASISTMKEKIVLHEEMKKNPEDQNIWKKNLEEEKKYIEADLASDEMPERWKSEQRQRLEMIDIYLNEDTKPVEQWEFYPTNVADVYMNIIGMVILAAGIAVFMSDIVSGESTPATLKFLLVQPVSRAKVILSKFIAITTTVVGMIAGLEALVYGVVGMITGFKASLMPTITGLKYKFDYTNLENYGYPEIVQIENSGTITTKGMALLQSYGLQILFIITCCAFIFMISTIVKSSMVSMALSVIAVVASTMLSSMSPTITAKVAHLIFFNYGATPQVVSGNIAAMFGNPNMTLPIGIALMIVTTIVCYLVSLFVFKKKDILA